MRINNVKKGSSDEIETSKVMRLAAVRPTWRHFCSMDFKVKGSAACKALHEQPVTITHGQKGVYFATTCGDHNRAYCSSGSTSRIYCIPSRKISRRLRAEAKTFHLQIYPKSFSHPYVYKQAFPPLLFLYSRLCWENAIHKQAAVGFQSLGRKERKRERTESFSQGEKHNSNAILMIS